MNKLAIMKQQSVDSLLSEMITQKPGVTSERLWAAAKEWDHRITAWDFDSALASMHGKFRVTNKQWYPIGHVAEPKRKGPQKEHPKQTRMDW